MSKSLEIFESMATATFCNYDEMNWCEFSMKDRFLDEEIDLVRKALERNIPIRPYVHDENSYPECPACRVMLEARYSHILERVAGGRFCQECGQALDWGK